MTVIIIIRRSATSSTMPKYTTITSPELNLDSVVAFRRPLIRQRGLTEVTRHSPRPHKNAVYRLASYFRRELNYDFVQYHPNDTDDYRAFIWDEHRYESLARPHSVVGAACFRWREWTDAPHGYALQWVWIHPFFRRQGLLREAWPHFQEQFKDFVAEAPLSLAMKQFLKKVDA